MGEGDRGPTEGAGAARLTAATLTDATPDVPSRLPIDTPSVVPVGKVRMRRPGGRKKNRPVTPSDELAVAQLAGTTSLSQTRIGAVLGMAQQTVQHVLARPHVAEMVAKMRDAQKPIVMANLVTAAVTAGDWLQDVIKDKDAKAFDSITRGIAAMEKTAASVAGENKPGNVQVAVINQTSEQSDEMKALIAALVGGGR